MYSNRPKFDIEPTSLDRALNKIALAGLVFAWCYTGFHYARLPQTIPIHFNAAGQVDGYGNKITIWLLPVLLTLVFWGMSALGKYPELFNYPKTITPGNAERNYRASIRLVSWLKLEIVILLFFIMQQIVKGAYGKSSLGWWFLPALILFFMLPTVGFWLSARKKEEKT